MFLSSCCRTKSDTYWILSKPTHGTCDITLRLNVNEIETKEKRRDPTQKNPKSNAKTQKTPPIISTTQRLRTDLGQDPFAIKITCSSCYVYSAWQSTVCHPKKNVKCIYWMSPLLLLLHFFQFGLHFWGHFKWLSQVAIGFSLQTVCSYISSSRQFQCMSISLHILFNTALHPK